MIKIERVVKEEDAIKGKIKIDPIEWKEFNQRMYEAGKELKSKEIGSIKSAYKVWVR